MLEHGTYRHWRRAFVRHREATHSQLMYSVVPLLFACPAERIATRCDTATVIHSTALSLVAHLVRPYRQGMLERGTYRRCRRASVRHREATRSTADELSRAVVARLPASKQHG